MERADVFHHGEDALLYVRICDSLWLVLERVSDQVARIYFADGDTMHRVAPPPDAAVYNQSTGERVPECAIDSFLVAWSSDYVVTVGGAVVARLARGVEQAVTVRRGGAVLEGGAGPEASEGRSCRCGLPRCLEAAW